MVLNLLVLVYLLWGVEESVACLEIEAWRFPEAECVLYIMT